MSHTQQHASGIAEIEVHLDNLGYRDLKAVRAIVDDAMEERRAEALADFERMRKTLMTDYDLDPQDPSPANPPRPAGVRIKYQDPATGNHWSGRGKQPNWLTAKLAAGSPLEQFLVG
jgi:DNA-binding protein H-NS